MSEYRLTAEILALSVAKIWNDAKLEWHIAEVRKDEEPSTCLCGHNPILEVCTIRNEKTGCSAVVGNCCVKKFVGLSSDKIFRAVARVQRDWWRALNAETIEHAYERGWITHSARDLYRDTMRKKIGGMNGEQSKTRYEINMLILGKIIHVPLHPKAENARSSL